jgi:hypothetical protein
LAATLELNRISYTRNAKCSLINVFNAIARIPIDSTGAAVLVESTRHMVCHLGWQMGIFMSLCDAHGYVNDELYIITKAVPSAWPFPKATREGSGLQSIAIDIGLVRE